MRNILANIRRAAPRANILLVTSSAFIFEAKMTNYSQDTTQKEKKSSNNNWKCYHISKLYCAMGIWKKNISYSFYRDMFINKCLLNR